MQGNNENIFSYKAPELNLDIKKGYSLTVPAGAGVVGVTGRVGGGVAIQLGFGFDTDGFCITDFLNVNEVQLKGNFGIGPSITAGGLLATLAVTVDADLGIGFNLNDPTPGDGKVRLGEIRSFDNLFTKFNTSLSAGLSSTIDILGTPIIGVGVKSSPIPLGQFSLAAIEEKADKVLGYVEQIKDLHNGKTVARLTKKGRGQEAAMLLCFLPLALKKKCALWE